MKDPRNAMSDEAKSAIKTLALAMATTCLTQLATWGIEELKAAVKRKREIPPEGT